jgi:RNA polymerase sigma-70 factor (ECF subfamily)
MPAFANDSIVLDGLQKGEDAAFDRVYELYFKPLCYFAERLTGDKETAQDMVAESFVRLLKKRLHFESMSSLKSFLYTATRNNCYDYFRSEKRHKASHAELKYLAVDSENEVEANIIRAEVLAAIYTAIETLPDRYKQVVKLALVEGKKNDEIAAETGMAYQTVRNHKSEGIKLLRLAIFKNGNLSDPALIYTVVYLSQHFKGL